MLALASLDHRERIPELMDEPDIDPAEHRAALAGLARINKLSLSDAILWPSIRALAEAHPGRTIRVLDIATGSGDVPISLWKRARGANISLAIEGCDISPTAVQNATENARDTDVRFFVHDVVHEPLPTDYDVVMCSLFLHHLSEEGAVTVLRHMRDASHELVLVNDLERSRLGFALAWIGTRLLSRSPVVRFDGPASVRSAFTPKEALALAERAGLTGAKVGRRWPFRYLLSWRRR
jgi:2-polyprenyl-3-methyl-5-hydroxy-6-metoxy-1,4-benzoquinol methylase